MLDLAEIRRRREKLLMTLDEAAKRAGFTSRQQWYIIESGTRPDVKVSTLDKIAKALECEPADLLK